MDASDSPAPFARHSRTSGDSRTLRAVHGQFRRDLELLQGRPPTFRLRRRRGARILSWGLAAAALVATALDVVAGRPFVAAVQLTLAVAFIGVLVRTELDSWLFDGRHFVHRSFTGLGFHEVRLRARSIREVGVDRAKGRARAWIETAEGEQYALVEGADAEVERIVEGVRRSLLLAAAEPPTRSLH
jgi:hypothetical protein